MLLRSRRGARVSRLPEYLPAPLYSVGARADTFGHPLPPTPRFLTEALPHDVIQCFISISSAYSHFEKQSQTGAQDTADFMSLRSKIFSGFFELSRFFPVLAFPSVRFMLLIVRKLLWSPDLVSFDPPGKIVTGQKDLVPAGQAFETDVRPDPDHFPFAAPAGMRLAEGHAVIHFNVFHSNYYKTNSSGVRLFHKPEHTGLKSRCSLFC